MTDPVGAFIDLPVRVAETGEVFDAGLVRVRDFGPQPRAAAIARAVNSHDALVSALTDVLAADRAKCAECKASVENDGEPCGDCPFKRAETVLRHVGKIGTGAYMLGWIVPGTVDRTRKL